MVDNSYLITLFNQTPLFVYIIALVLFAITSISVIYLKREKMIIALSRIGVIEFAIIVFCTTLICRAPSMKRSFNLIPFWSYNRPDLIKENIMNVIVFVPLGFLARLSFPRCKWWVIILMGCCFSLTIEIMQFILRRGFMEVDDVVHNTLGCMIGCFLSYPLVKVFLKI